MLLAQFHGLRLVLTGHAPSLLLGALSLIVAETGLVALLENALITLIRASGKIADSIGSKLFARIFTDYHVFLTTIRGLVIGIFRLDSLGHSFLWVYCP